MFRFPESTARWLIDHWLLVLPLVLGFVAVWLLLPQPRRRPLLVPVLAGIAGLVVGGLVLLRATGPAVATLFDVLFYIFAGMAVVSAVCTIAQHNPVYAALWFALVILSTCGLFLLQSAPFLAAATIIIYAGAIIVTFLFVIMLAQQTGLAPYDRRSREPLLASLAGFTLLAVLLYLLQATFVTPPKVERLQARREVLDQVLDQLAKVQDLVDRREETDAIDQAMYLGRNPLSGVLREQTKEQMALEGVTKETAEQVLQEFDDLVMQWPAAKSDKDYGQMTAFLAEMRTLASKLRQRLTTEERHGFLQIPASLESQRPSLSRPGNARDLGQVKGLGRSLFGDYLWGVELAGTLLLVATIGAILIASRRKEEPA